MMKCRRLILLAALLSAAVFSSCGKKADAPSEKAAEGNGLAAVETDGGAGGIQTSPISADGSFPAFRFSGEPAYMNAILDYLTEKEGRNYEPGDVMIPNFLIFRAEDTDPENIRVWGSFWLMNYDLEGDSLQLINGGSYAGLFTLKEAGGSYEVTEADLAGKKGSFEEDIERIFGVDEGLRSAYYRQGEQTEQNRQETILAYARDCGRLLNVNADPAGPGPGSSVVVPVSPDLTGTWKDLDGQGMEMLVEKDDGSLYTVTVSRMVSALESTRWRFTGSFAPGADYMTYEDCVCIRVLRGASGEETEETVFEAGSGNLRIDPGTKALIWHGDQMNSIDIRFAPAGP
jgi:hypothetical protein